MIRFTNDYSEGCHPSILEAMAATNTEGNPGYSTDPHSARARRLIQAAIGRPDADVHILVGGTQTNATAIAAFLRPYEAVIAATSAHICVHETGAIEATGHKCIACPAADGKLTPAAVRAAVAAHPDEHMVKPRMVYISQTTETGTLYTLAEVQALRAVCDELGLLLYLDGARLAAGLAAGGPSLPELARLCDAFYIGGTKNGALFGEALVLLNDALKPDFRYNIKQRGGMLAKGWLLGIQFETPDGPAAESGHRGAGLSLCLRQRHQPAVPHLPRRGGGGAGAGLRVRVFRKARRGPHLHPAGDQLGHPRGQCGRLFGSPAGPCLTVTARQPRRRADSPPSPGVRCGRWAA